jgi:hypothetical protein
MKRFSAGLALQQGSSILFSDFANDGPMWSGSGPREVRHPVVFKPRFLGIPAVMVSISMWDTDHKSNLRADLTADTITPGGFDLVFRTWGDSRIARIRADWTAFGSVEEDDDWEVE